MATPMKVLPAGPGASTSARTACASPSARPASSRPMSRIIWGASPRVRLAAGARLATGPTEPLVTVTDNPDRRRFELDVDGQTVFADYRRRDGVLAITHVEAPPALRGTGAAGRPMEGVMQIARAENVKVRSEERRVGEGCARQWRSRGGP